MATFRVKNSYPFAVATGPISKGCSCSEAVISPAVIPAGSEAELSVTWTLRGKRGNTSESLYFTYADAQQGNTGEVRARLVASVHGAVDPDQEVVELSTTKRQAAVAYVSKSGRDFRITHAATNHKSLSASVQPGGRVV